MWIIPKSLQSSGSLATVEIISDSNELSRACASSLFVRSKPLSAQMWSRKWKAASWTQHLVGRIAAPFHLNHSKIELRFLSLPILAKDFRLPVSGWDRAIPGTSGHTSDDSSRQ